MTASDPLRLCLWSGPRNVSTALMYSFAQRADTEAVDEPLYGHYLRVSGAEHPGGDTVLAAMETNGEAVVRDVILAPSARPIRFFKMMAHHLTDLDEGFLDRTTNALLTRHPREVLPTLSVQVPNPTLRDTGYQHQVDLLRRDLAAGRRPLVIEARELLLSPPTVLERLCERVGIAFDPAMLSWPPGPKDCDGVWAPWWYHNVHRSTGFLPWQPKDEPLPPELAPLLEQCLPLYEELSQHAIPHD